MLSFVRTPAADQGARRLRDIGRSKHISGPDVHGEDHELLARSRRTYQMTCPIRLAGLTTRHLARIIAALLSRCRCRKREPKLFIRGVLPVARAIAAIYKAGRNNDPLCSMSQQRNLTARPRRTIAETRQHAVTAIPVCSAIICGIGLESHPTGCAEPHPGNAYRHRRPPDMSGVATMTVLLPSSACATRARAHL